MEIKYDRLTNVTNLKLGDVFYAIAWDLGGDIASGRSSAWLSPDAPCRQSGSYWRIEGKAF